MKFKGFFKRFFDFFGALVGLIILAPLFLFIAVSIKITFSKGAFFFHQKRMGKDGKVFKIWKFRTMSTEVEKLEIPVDKIREFEISGQDPRVNKLNKFFRRFGFDELPQLINILRGEMSFVGPRPYFLARIESNGLLKERLKVKPGLTSLAVIKGGIQLSEEELLKLDLEYIRNQNFWLDIKILLKSIILVLSGKGFYGK